jgi:hypothetical protein
VIVGRRFHEAEPVGLTVNQAVDRLALFGEASTQ